MAKWPVEEKIPWGALGVVIAVLFGAFGVYTTFFYEKRARVVYEVDSATRVLDIRENVPQLDVTFQGESIRDKQETLSVITVKIMNAGNLDIGMGAFDSSNLPGLRVSHTKKIFKPEFVRGSSSYFSVGERVRLKDESSFEILPVLLDKHEFFVIKILVLHRQDEAPTIEKFGKFGGVSQTEVTTVSSSEDRRGLFFRTFSGDSVIQFVRAVGYTVATLALLIAGIVLTIATHEGWRRWKRNRLVKKFRTLLGHPISPAEDAILTAYVKGNFEPYNADEFIIQMNALLSNPAQLEKTLRQKERIPEHENYLFPVETIGVWTGSAQIVPLLKEKKLVTLKDHGVAIDEQVAKTVSEFENFLLANDPERIKKFKVPYGSDSDPIKAEDLITAPGSEKPGNE
jgi:hypothetical protein